MKPFPLLLVVVVACGGAAETSETTEPSTTPPTPTSERALPEGTLPGPLDAEGEPAALTGEVPAEILASIRVDAARRTSVPAEDFSEIRSQEMVWNDGSLGCAEPGQLYTQAIVHGYWVVLEAGDISLDYRVSEDGSFRLCEQASTGL